MRLHDQVLIFEVQTTTCKKAHEKAEERVGKMVTGNGSEF